MRPRTTKCVLNKRNEGGLPYINWTSTRYFYLAIYFFPIAFFNINYIHVEIQLNHRAV